MSKMPDIDTCMQYVSDSRFELVVLTAGIVRRLGPRVYDLAKEKAGNVQYHKKYLYVLNMISKGVFDMEAEHSQDISASKQISDNVNLFESTETWDTLSEEGDTYDPYAAHAAAKINNSSEDGNQNKEENDKEEDDIDEDTEDIDDIDLHDIEEDEILEDDK